MRAGLANAGFSFYIRYSKSNGFDTPYLYGILTYGNAHGGAAEIAKKYCDSVGVEAAYINQMFFQAAFNISTS